MAFEGVPRAAAPKTTHGRFKGQDKIFAGVEMRLELQYNVDPRKMLGKRNLRRHLRVVNRAMLLYWHKRLRPIHFTQRASGKYKYQRRTNATVIIKKEQFGHNLPLKQKGIAESLTGNVKSLRVTPTTGSLVMHGPWYLGHRTKRKRGGLSPDLKDELTRVDLKDAQMLAEIGSEILAKKFEQDKRRRLGAHRETP